jgi:hypothetical protein
MTKPDPNLHGVLRLKSMAAAIATHGVVGAGQGDALARAYERARNRAGAFDGTSLAGNQCQLR